MHACPPLRRHSALLTLLVAAGALAGTGAAEVMAQSASPTSPPEGGWYNIGGDFAHTRSAPLDQIHAGNFGDLEVAWLWRGDNFGPSVDNILRSTPIYAEGKLFTVAGSRRQVAAIDPATGETLWTWRMRHTKRWEDSMRKSYGRGVSYDVVNGRGRIYVVDPGFFLVALDAETGRPIEDFGEDGIVDLMVDLGYPFDGDEGIPPEIGYITNSAPPMVVDGVVIVGNSGEQGYYQTRRQEVAGHILAYDGRTGEHLWKFHVIPRPGEYGNDTWEDGSWEYSGNVGSWAPMAADPALGLVYITTKGATNDYYGGHRPGDELFGNSVIALDYRTGERRWHYQLVRHDVWNYDNPHAPQLVDITVEGERVPALVQVTKQGWAYVFNRETGEPVWPFDYREVPQSDVPGERLSAVQPFVTRPAAFEHQGITEDDLIDYTPELRAEALEIVSNYRLGPLFNPPSRRDAPDGTVASIHCPGANGGANIPGGASVDPESGILYVASFRGCSAPQLLPGTEVDPDATMDFVTIGPGGVRGPQGLPLLKPPYGTITAIDLNTGDHLWQIPNGDTPANVRNHAALQGVDLPVTGKTAHATVLVTSTLLMYGEGRGGEPLFHAVDKQTGETLASVSLPATTNTAPMTFMHEGVQYIVAAVGGAGVPGSLVALRVF
ncbi:MAG: pyrroloquinoline quinone-dependent dehydrogenase [Gemmatimonadales bacterium]|nr:MAG: pyrroloquinoline quinone-dependent dehydrogenase [Gemmatimonadales bacterium]